MNEEPQASGEPSTTVSIVAGPLVGPVLRRVVGMLAARADLPLDRLDDASAALLRPELARRTGLQTTFGWGPRFLHSTGQYHKGGHQNGAFLQITGEP